MDNEIKLLVKLKHPDPLNDPVGFVNSLPVRIMDLLYYNSDLDIDEKRARARIFFQHGSKDSIKFEYYIILKYLKQYYDGQEPIIHINGQN